MSDQEIPMVRASILKPVVRAFAEEGFDAGELLAQHQITKETINDASKFVHNTKVYQVFESLAEATGRKDFCCSVGEQIDLVDFLSFGKKLQSAVTLGDYF